MTRKSVMDALNKELEVYTIKIKGSRKDKSEAFYILVNTQTTTSFEKDVFCGISNSTLKLLIDAEINFEIVGSSPKNRGKSGGKNG